MVESFGIFPHVEWGLKYILVYPWKERVFIKQQSFQLNSQGERLLRKKLNMEY